MIQLACYISLKNKTKTKIKVKIKMSFIIPGFSIEGICYH